MSAVVVDAYTHEVRLIFHVCAEGTCAPDAIDAAHVERHQVAMFPVEPHWGTWPNTVEPADPSDPSAVATWQQQCQEEALLLAEDWLANRQPQPMTGLLGGHRDN